MKHMDLTGLETLTPEEAYQAQQNLIEARLASLLDLLQAHAQGAHDWAHVGDLSHVEKSLTDLMIFLLGGEA